MRRSHRKKAIISSFNECLNSDELAIAVQIWSENVDLLQEKADLIIESIVRAFERSATLIPIKTYIMVQVARELSYTQIDRILTSLENRFSDIEEDAGNQYLLVNLNSV